MGNRDLSDIYALALRAAAFRLGHICQANSSCPCYNYYIYTNGESTLALHLVTYVMINTNLLFLRTITPMITAKLTNTISPSNVANTITAVGSLVSITICIS